MSERRKFERKDFTYYMRLMNSDTGQLVGHLSDISEIGFKLDSPEPLPLNKDYRLRMDLTSDVSHKPYILFGARTRWCQEDELNPTQHNVGFQITQITSEDFRILKTVVERYASNKTSRRVGGKW